MKKYIISLLLAAVCMAACSKLEVSPRGEMADKQAAYTNATIRSQVLAGVYSYLLRDATFGAFVPIYLESATDVEISRITASGNIENNSHQPKDLNDTWSYLYNGINAANEFIYYARLHAPKATQEIAEARFLRAYYYFTLVRLFGDVPFRTEPMLDLNNTDIARTSAVTIYDFIVKEMAEVQSTLLGPQSVVYGHVSNTTAQAALADVYLNLSGYLMKDRLPADSTSVLMHQRAAYWCKQVIDNPSHDITKTDYVTIFKNQVQSKANINENVWELQFLYQRNSGTIRTDTRLGKYNGMGSKVEIDGTLIYNMGGYTYQAATLRKLYEKVDTEDATKDVRMEWNCPREKIVATLNGNVTRLGFPVYDKAVDYEKYPNNLFQFFVGKWRTIFSENATEAADNNYAGTRLSMYRIADVHLMYAEALNAGENNQAGAVEQLNIVRRRAGATEIRTAGSQQEVFDLIVDERARELCFEGKRRFDLIRWGLYESKLRALEPYYKDPTVNEGWVKDKVAAFNNFNPALHYIMPIPQAEISRNMLIPQSEQNLGWGGNRKWK